MSRLGYFIGGMLTGIVGTVVVAHVVNVCSASSTGASDDVDEDDSASMMENSDSTEAEDVVNANNEEPCMA